MIFENFDHPTIRSQRRITNELIVLEWITLILMIMMLIAGRYLKESSPQIFFICKDRSIKAAEISGIPEWMISFGKQLQISAVVLIQMFIVAELIMYIILFRVSYSAIQLKSHAST